MQQTKDESYVPLTSAQAQGGYSGYVPPAQYAGGYPQPGYPGQQAQPQQYGYAEPMQAYPVGGAPGQYSGAQYVGTTVQADGTPGGYVYMASTAQPGAADANNMAVSALVCGILSVVLLPFILSILATIFGGIAINRIRQFPRGTPGMASNMGMAVAGIILGCISFITYIVVIAVVVSATDSLVNHLIS